MKPEINHEVLLSAKVLAVGDIEGSDEGHCDIQLPSGIKIHNVPTSDILDSRLPAEVGNGDQNNPTVGEQEEDDAAQEEIKKEAMKDTPPAEDQAAGTESTQS